MATRLLRGFAVIVEKNSCSISVAESMTDSVLYSSFAEQRTTSIMAETESMLVY